MKDKMYWLFIFVVLLAAFGIYQSEIFHSKAIKDMNSVEKNRPSETDGLVLFKKLPSKRNPHQI